MKSLKLLFALSLIISASLQAQPAQWELVRRGLRGTYRERPEQLQYHLRCR